MITFFHVFLHMKKSILGRQELNNQDRTMICYETSNLHHRNLSRIIMTKKTEDLEEEMVRLPLGFTPSQFDIIVGTGREAKNHNIGNRNFRHLLKKYVEDYSKRSKLEKGRVISQIITEAKHMSPTRTGFVKQMKGIWYAVGQTAAREKVSQSLRNELHDKYRSSIEFKKKRRIQIREEVDGDVQKIIQQKGNFISQRMSEVSKQLKKKTKNLSDERICELLTQANIDILEGLKRTTRERTNKKENRMDPKES